MHSDQFFIKSTVDVDEIYNTPQTLPRQAEPSPVRAGPCLCADVTHRSESHASVTHRATSSRWAASPREPPGREASEPDRRGQDSGAPPAPSRPTSAAENSVSLVSLAVPMSV